MHYDRVDDRPVPDVAIVMESTYPYLKGGVSAVVHDIVRENHDLTFGIIHISWDSSSPTEDLYGVPENVLWIHTLYLSMQEHRHDFMALNPGVLKMNSADRARLATRLFSAVQAIFDGDMTPMWRLYDEGMNPLTREFPVWALLGSREFMEVLQTKLASLGLPLTDAFWLMREFFSLSYALLNEVIPRARVYHAHTTGYASLIGAAAARQHGAKFLLTEHNLYVRDTVNTLLDRNMALQVKANDWREFDVDPTKRAWMAWWIEMGRFCYPSASHITYLYREAIAEARDLGAPMTDDVMSIVPNGMTMKDFDGAYSKRLRAIEEMLLDGSSRVWRLAYIARVVPIKGLLEFVSSARLLIDRGVTNWGIDILGPTDHVPAAYLKSCMDRIDELGMKEFFTFRGTVNVRAVIGDYELLVLPSFNEGQPIVVLEAMTAAVPTIGTIVGGMPQLISERLTHETGRTWDSCGVLVDPANMIPGIADALQSVLADLEGYEQLARNARGRVEDFFQLHEAMLLYNRLYRHLAGLSATSVADNAADTNFHGSVEVGPNAAVGRIPVRVDWHQVNERVLPQQVTGEARSTIYYSANVRAAHADLGTELTAGDLIGRDEDHPNAPIAVAAPKSDH
ncbi:GT4 family glycosyltransferase PelF [Virgisporangium aurantiacum]|uniref:LPS N-acetylglucosaminyltransferase n=1 Tax=Virgisporangium aurantiacum TaxID=175570 RepID=A0A8J3Z8A5_9ACTN|nr:GT4 family glycosyltransferase PelF [Virgisporangium aurantiacum]GIJ58892.1 LPS N-acetylglucosaminyltransferase [Virgisporangium aurantiacum]